MNRIPEPELMESAEQSAAYATADFSDSNNRFVDLLCSRCSPGSLRDGILDLGCGDGDILFRLARKHKEAKIVGVDGSAAMLSHATSRLRGETILSERLEFIHAVIPNLAIPHHSFGAIISNSLLHHLHQPSVFWETVKRFGKPGAAVFVMDLSRPASTDKAARIVETYASGAPEVLKNDFYNSLLAAFTEAEVKKQLEEASLGWFQVEEASDRHFIAFGSL